MERGIDRRKLQPDDSACADRAAPFHLGPASRRDAEFVLAPPRHGCGEEPLALHRVGPWIPVTPVVLVPTLAGGDRFIVNIADWCRSHRHQPVKEQHAALTRRIAGHFNYFGVNGNVPCLKHVQRVCGVVWHKWLNRRSQRASKDWDQFNDLLRTYPLPRAAVYVQLWSSP